jgi:hypothetical protein
LNVLSRAAEGFSPTTDFESVRKDLRTAAVSIISTSLASYLSSLSATSTKSGFLQRVSSIGLKTSRVSMRGARSLVLKIFDSSATTCNTA